jgi:crossover junction endodeoxyribonuclease RusA
VNKVLITLPWPPSVNDYWEGMGRRRHVGQRGKDYRYEVFWTIRQGRFNGHFQGDRVAVDIRAFPPEKVRRRDLDNLLKCVLDSLTHAGLWTDDSQVDDLRVVRGEPEGRGRLIVTVSRLTDGEG